MGDCVHCGKPQGELMVLDVTGWMHHRCWLGKEGLKYHPPTCECSECKEWDEYLERWKKIKETEYEQIVLRPMD